MFKNINSTMNSTSDICLEVEKRLKIISKNFWQHDIYLINPELMDIFYPRTKRKGIDISNLSYDVPEIPKWSKIKKQNKIAIGVYIGKFNSLTYLKKLNKLNNKNIISELASIKGPSIFICPERVLKIQSLEKRTKSNEAEINVESEIKCSNDGDIKKFEILLLKICIHEMAHHYMSQNTDNFIKARSKTVKISKEINKLIEESLANAFAWSQFSEAEELKIIEAFMDSQPFEYSAYRYWINNGRLKQCVPFLISSWKYKINPFIPEYTFKYFDDIFSIKYFYNVDDKNAMLNFNFEHERLRIVKRLEFNDGKKFWEAIALSMIHFFYCKKENCDFY